MNKKDGDQSFDLSNYIDKHLRELRWTSYGLGALATVLIIRSLKATNKFTSIKEIPAHFISNSYTLQGHIKHVTDGGVLHIEHIPIIQVKLFNRILNIFNKEKDSVECLLIRPAAVELNREAIDWIKTHANSKHAWFQLLLADEDILDCDIKIKQGYFVRTSVSKELLKQGLCTIQHFERLPEGEHFNQYLTELIRVEHKAAKRGKGIWTEEHSWLRRKSWAVSSWSREKIKSFYKKR